MGLELLPRKPYLALLSSCGIPLLFVGQKDECPFQVCQRFMQLSAPMREELLKLSVQPNKSKRMALKLILDNVSLELASRIMRLEDTLSTNAFNIDYNNPAYYGLFLTASRLNHSCVPNALKHSQKIPHGGDISGRRT